MGALLKKIIPRGNDRKEARQLIETMGKKPGHIASIMVELLEEIALGHRLQIIPEQAELTTQEAADLLNVSRPYLVGLLDKKKIPCRKVGKHRRVLYNDIMDYKRQVDRERVQILLANQEEASDEVYHRELAEWDITNSDGLDK